MLVTHELLAGCVDFWNPLELTLTVCKVGLHLLSRLKPPQPIPRARPGHAPRLLPRLSVRSAAVCLGIRLLPFLLFRLRLCLRRGFTCWSFSVSVCQEFSPRGTNTPGLYRVPFYSSEMGRGRERGRERGGKKSKPTYWFQMWLSLTALSSNLIKFPQTARRVS